MRIVELVLIISLCMVSVTSAGNASEYDNVLVRFGKVSMRVPNGFEYKKDVEKMFVARKSKNINNFIVISSIGAVDVDSFIAGLRNDGSKMILLAVNEETVGGLSCRVVRYRIAEDDIKKILVSYFIEDQDIRIIYYGLVEEFTSFARILDSLKFDE